MCAGKKIPFARSKKKEKKIKGLQQNDYFFYPPNKTVII